jgi:hypothetical protein
MNMVDNPIRDLHEVLAHAQYEGFSDIEYEARDWEAMHKAKTVTERAEALHKTIPATRRPHGTRDFWVYAMFPQSWGSTALGQAWPGGASTTTAYTIVLECLSTQEYLVYFGGVFCYKVSRRSQNLELFRQDLSQRNLASKRDCAKYN